MKKSASLTTEDILDILDSAHQLCVTLKERSDLLQGIHKHLLVKKANSTLVREALDDYVAAEYSYLRQKFDWFWFSEESVCAYYKKLRSIWDFFSPKDFEELVRTMLYLIERKPFLQTPGSHDKGIDLYCDEGFETDGLYLEVLSIAQCKLYKGTVPVAEVRDFFGVMTSKCALGYFFTTGKLTNAGNQFVSLANRSPHSNSFHCVQSERLNALLSLCDVIAQLHDDLNEPQITNAKFNRLLKEYEKNRKQARAILHTH